MDPNDMPQSIARHLTALLGWLPWVIAGASVTRVGVHWLRGFLQVWVSPDSRLWPVFDRLERSLSYIAISLAAFGKKPGSGNTGEMRKIEKPKDK